MINVMLWGDKVNIEGGVALFCVFFLFAKFQSSRKIPSCIFWWVVVFVVSVVVLVLVLVVPGVKQSQLLVFKN